jgi:hypothetical protein
MTASTTPRAVVAKVPKTASKPSEAPRLIHTISCRVGHAAIARRADAGPGIDRLGRQLDNVRLGRIGVVDDLRAFGGPGQHPANFQLLNVFKG